MLVETILQTKGVLVHTLPETATIADAVATLNQHNIGAVVITDTGGAIIGILSERDIVRRLSADPSSILGLSIADCMVRGVVTGTPATSVDEIMERMTNHHIRHVPIVDVVKSKLEAAEQEAIALRDYIAS